MFPIQFNYIMLYFIYLLISRRTVACLLRYVLDRSYDLMTICLNEKSTECMLG